MDHRSYKFKDDGMKTRFSKPETMTIMMMMMMMMMTMMMTMMISKININKTNNIETNHEWRRYSNQTAGITTTLVPTPIFIPLDGAQPTQHATTDPSRAFQSRSDDSSINTTTAHSHDTALVAHLQRLFYPLPMLHRITPIFTPFNIVLSPTESMQQQHQSKHHHPQQTTQTRGHKALTHAWKTTMTTAAANGSKNSKISADANNKEDTAYAMRRPPTGTHTLTLHSTYLQ